MARSGTTWVAELINFDHRRRLMFEPFTARKVPEAFCFGHVQYLNPLDRNPVQLAQARQILSGGVSNAWTDQHGSWTPGSPRIIKEIRCNLMLGWLQAVFPEMPIVLVMRHPLAIAASLLKLGWGTGFEAIIPQPDLLADFPMVREAIAAIDQNDPFEQVLFVWGVFHLVPFSQCRPGALFPVQYEALVLHPERELARLFGFLGLAFDWEHLGPMVRKSSGTNYLGRNHRTDTEQLLSGWRTQFTRHQVERAAEILSLFGWEIRAETDGPDQYASRAVEPYDAGEAAAVAKPVRSGARA